MQNERDPEATPYREAEHTIDAAFLNRWSPRAFSPEPINDETLRSVFGAARWAASSSNEQPWRFLLARSESCGARFLDFLTSQASLSGFSRTAWPDSTAISRVSP